MNEEQVKSALRWAVSAFGCATAGWFAAKGWLTTEQVMGILNSPVILSAIASLVMGGWGIFVHSKTNTVAVVDAMPEVAGVVTTPTGAGRALAAAVPSLTVAPAQTPAASVIAGASHAAQSGEIA